MPGAASRGKSDEDKEHKRPDYLVEADSDDALGFQIATDECLGRLVRMMC